MIRTGLSKSAPGPPPPLLLIPTAPVAPDPAPDPEPELLRSCFRHLRFRKHDVAVFHLLDPLELSFEFRRPTRFVDLEGLPPMFADPAEIADRYHAALRLYLGQLKEIVLESAIDYQRVGTDEDYERVLARFLVGRTRRRARSPGVRPATARAGRTRRAPRRSAGTGSGGRAAAPALRPSRSPRRSAG